MDLCLPGEFCVCCGREQHAFLHLPKESSLSLMYMAVWIHVASAFCCMLHVMAHYQLSNTRLHIVFRTTVLSPSCKWHVLPSARSQGHGCVSQPIRSACNNSFEVKTLQGKGKYGLQMLHKNPSLDFLKRSFRALRWLSKPSPCTLEI